ncbi:transposase [Streptococcus sp. Marseille-Q5986]|uniref:transposase n=1 Tax=Streptococcus sp. Marseille-Q5986 TaxID=2972782 RepID=UPI002264B52C|nr:transposase [Streptococcus sp. Marseille-Q5986]
MIILSVKKVLRKIKDNFSVRAEKYESYQDLKTKKYQVLSSPEGRQIFAQRKIVFGQIKACLGYKRCNLRGMSQVKIDLGLVLMTNNLLKYNKRTT